jgi:hypothetical protein
MEVFIVRPFGLKSWIKKDNSTGSVEIVNFDFDKVETELIAPALKDLKIPGGTTGEIFESGDIREDMFSLLLSADIVVADITIHNANVFYELGIRHALRDKKTILIKCGGFDETPFDILGYRYVSYKKENPSEAIPQLVNTLVETKASERKDSPVFNMLPKLETQDPVKLMAVPVDFVEEAEIYANSRQVGMLSLMAEESESFPWKIPALRLIGEKLYKLRAYENARIVWEKILIIYAEDIEANDRLATIYQRLAEKVLNRSPQESEEQLAQSDLTINKVLKNISEKEVDKKAEAYALKGRNEKTRWLQNWRKLPASEWSKNALESGFLFKALDSYYNAYFMDLNHYYSGINALGLLTVIIELAVTNPETWELLYDSKEQAEQRLIEYKQNHQNLANAVKFTIDANKSRLKAIGKSDPWLNITEADYACLTKTDPGRIKLLYKKVLENESPLNQEAALRQLKIYEQLNVVPENVKAVLAEFPDVHFFEETMQKHYLLFTGHMIDKPGRSEPRFPPEKEPEVRKRIKEEVQKINEKFEGKITGIAGGACGGDVLFHEICDELGIPSEIYLALPRDRFVVESVAFAGTKWVDRFDELYRNKKWHILSQTKDLPNWLQKKKEYTIWERNNLWELHCALVEGGINMTLIALWNGKGGDGPGGTADMVREAKARGAKTIIINPEVL